MYNRFYKSINIGGVKNLAIWHHKSYFIYFTTLLYKTPDIISGFILAFNTIK